MTTDDDQEPEWRKKQKEYEIKKARAKALKLRLTCSICSEKAKLNCPCGTTQYCSTECQRIDWRDRGHRKACKKIRDERAAEAARAEAPTPPPSPPVYGPAPRSHADEVRARIAAEHEAARARREANPEPEPESAGLGSRCPICLEDWEVNARYDRQGIFLTCCSNMICNRCDSKTFNLPCPLCRAPFPKCDADHLRCLRRHVENEVPAAIGHLGQAYHFGKYGLKSGKKAVKLYKRAVELGDVRSRIYLGRLYALGDDGVKIDKKKAMQVLRPCADRGNAHGQHNLACLLDQERSYKEAFSLFKRAAEQGYTPAKYHVGSYLLHGRPPDVERDCDEGIRWVESAAADGSEEAKDALAQINAIRQRA